MLQALALQKDWRRCVGVGSGLEVECLFVAEPRSPKVAILYIYTVFEIPPWCVRICPI